MDTYIMQFATGTASINIHLSFMMIFLSFLFNFCSRQGKKGKAESLLLLRGTSDEERNFRQGLRYHDPC